MHPWNGAGRPQPGGQRALPQLPLPEPLRGSDPGSFAYRTLSSRLPGIARRVLSARPWYDLARQNLQALAEDMPHGTLRPLEDTHAPDAAAWEADLAPYLGLTWLEAPWYISETYFFRRILEATGYYQSGPGFQLDPYLAEKQQEFEAAAAQVSSLCEDLEGTHPPVPQPEVKSGSAGRRREGLSTLLRRNIWGNQADRSMWPAGSKHSGPAQRMDGSATDHLLADHSGRVADFLVAHSPLQRIDLVLDNGGIELAYDLVLCDFLLDQQLTGEIHLHAKSHPTYVSDVTVPDLYATLDFFQQCREACVHSLAGRLQTALTQGRILLRTDFYWTSLRSGWEMPAALLAELGESGLVISKGDANYRRWLGDRHWPHTTSIDQILSYFPVPLLILRVLKANLVAGLPDGLSEKMYAQDPDWLHDGNWGIIQAAGLSGFPASNPGEA